MVHELVVGTRGSDLALTQAKMASDAIEKDHPEVHLVPRIIRTSADEGAQKIAAPPPAGRKGLFTAEIERALLAGEIDVAVHSAKDLPSELATGTEIIAVLPRAAAGDVLVTRERLDLHAIAKGGTVATGSVRRKHQLKWQRDDLQLVDLRGNVPTRLRKLHENPWDAVVLAMAGLERLTGSVPNEEMSYDDRTYFVSQLDRSIFVPAAGQGIIALQIRAGDKRVRDVVVTADDSATHLCLRAEREFLRLLQADCNCPIGVFAEINGSSLEMRVQLFTNERTEPAEAMIGGSAGSPEDLAGELFEEINER